MTTIEKTSVRASGVVALATVIGGLLSVSAFAADANVEEITVRAERATKTQVGRTSSGVPVLQYELGYKVGFDDLDLATESGAAALKQRLLDAAKSACADLDRLYPGVEPDRDCVRKAADETVPAFDAAIAAARKR
jgi:UrcA family protein